MISLSIIIYIHWLINRHKHFSVTNESMRTFLAQQRRVSARRQSTAPWSKLDISCSSTQNCRWTKCLHVFAAAWIFNFATSQFHKAFIPPKRMEVPKLWHLHSLLCLRFCSASFWVVLFVFSRLTFSQSVPIVTLLVTHSVHGHLQVFSFLSKTRIGGLWRKNLHERLTLEFEARARFLKDVLCELRSVVLSRAHPQYPPTISTLSPLTQIQRRNNVFKLAWTQATDGHTGGFMLPFPVSRDDRASMAAEAGLADVGRESKGLTVGKHVETTGQSNFYAAMVGHGIDRSKFCTMMSIATDVQVVPFRERGRNIINLQWT